MSWQPNHSFTLGARLPTGVQLATCAHCCTLRVTPDGRPSDRPWVHLPEYFIRRVDSDLPIFDPLARVTTAQPACLSPPAFVRQLGEAPGPVLNPAVRAVLDLMKSPAPAAPPEAPQLGLW